MTARFRHIQDLASAALWRQIPVEPDAGWLATVVDEPRFGWDWSALEKGFFAPLRAWAAHHDMRLRPVLAGLLIEALGQDPARYADILAALELQYQSAIMLDDLRNGPDLTSSTTAAISVPLPVWVTIAYNTRQLAPVLVMRWASGLPDAARVRLAHRFARFLLQQGLGSTLDLWGAQSGLAHASLDDLIAHLSVYVGTLSFGLACDVAAIAAGLTDRDGAELARAGVELGVALRLAELASGHPRQFSVDGKPVTEQLIRWRHGIAANQLAAGHDRLLESALAGARRISPAVAAVFSEFSDALQVDQREQLS